MADIKPRVGRKIDLWPNGCSEDSQGRSFRQINDGTGESQPFSGTIAFAYPDGTINVSAKDHCGATVVFWGVRLLEPDEPWPEQGTGKPFASWMPFQIGQARAQEAEPQNAEPQAAEIGDSTNGPATGDEPVVTSD